MRPSPIGRRGQLRCRLTPSGTMLGGWARLGSFPIGPVLAGFWSNSSIDSLVSYFDL